MTTNTSDRQLVTIVLVTLGLLLVLPVLFMGVGMMGFGPMMGGVWGTGMWATDSVPGWVSLVGILMPLLFLLAVVGGAFLVYRAVTGAESQDRAIEELRVAYARGELSDEEFERRRETLERGDAFERGP